MAAAGRSRQFTRAEIGSELPWRPGQTRFQQRCLEILPTPRPQPSDVGPEYSGERGDTAGDVVHRDADLGRPATRVAGHQHDARHALSNDVEAALFPVRPGLAEARHRRVDDLRVELPDGVVVDPELLDDAGPEVLRDDVGLCGESRKNLFAAPVLHVEGEALLVPVEDGEAIRFVVDLGIEAARCVAVGKVFDLDHFRAHIAEDHAAVGSCHDIGEVEHLHAFQRQSHVLPLQVITVSCAASISRNTASPVSKTSCARVLTRSGSAAPRKTTW